MAQHQLLPGARHGQGTFWAPFQWSTDINGSKKGGTQQPLDCDWDSEVLWNLAYSIPSWPLNIDSLLWRWYGMLMLAAGEVSSAAHQLFVAAQSHGSLRHRGGTKRWGLGKIGHRCFPAAFGWVGLSCLHQLIPQLKMLNAADPADQDGQKVKTQLKRFFAAARVNPLWSPPLLPVADAVFIDILSGLMGLVGFHQGYHDIHWFHQGY